ncbi:hypothetical protein [Terrarubrum flagellatum]|uniref:hypothetical protein n=1 Tax=Terrirubrum flagellatum TaxID=2895980 RepID=UPI003144F909
MATALTRQLLRGLMVTVARRDNVALDNLSLRALNAEVRLAVDHAGQPLYNQATTNDVKAVIAELRAGPFPTHDPARPMEQFSFEYWYNYFFKELAWARQLDFIMPVLNDDGSYRTENQVFEKERLFSEMLELGFTPFVANDKLTADQVMAHAIKDSLSELQRKNVNVLFRGDGRPSEKIKKDGGTKPQTRVDDLRVSRHMLSYWHPFKTRGDSVWVRKGFNQDNCLFSAVSVTPQFGVATKFPLLNDLEGSNPDAIGHAWVMVRDRTQAAGGSAFQQARQVFAKPQAESALRPLTLMASKSNIYVVRARSAYNTQNYQVGSTFPEYASEDLDWADHLLCFNVTRIHFGAGDANAGHLIVVNESRWLQDEALIASVLAGPASMTELRKFKADIDALAKLHSGAGGMVYTPPGVDPPPFDIVTVRESFRPGKPAPDSDPFMTDGRRKIAIPAAFRN